MARRVSWTNNSSGHLGTYVYRAPTLDPQNLPAPVATAAPVAQGDTAEWIDTSGEYGCYAVQDFDGSGVGALSAEVCTADPWADVQVGDAIEGGYFAGMMLDESDARYALIVAPKATGETTGAFGGGLSWGQAASFADGLTIGGFNDWVLPDRDELRVLYRAFKPLTTSNQTSYGATDRVDPPLGNYTASNPSQTSVGAFASTGSEQFETADGYWSSEAANSSESWRTSFYSGSELVRAKSNLYQHTRAVRRVPA